MAEAARTQAGREDVAENTYPTPGRDPTQDKLHAALAQARRVITSDDASGPRVAAPAPGVWMDNAVSDTARILTPTGARTVGSLEPGDMVITKDSGPMPVRWIGRHALSAAQLAEHPGLCPILVRKDAMNDQLPRRPMYVSPRANILVRRKALNGTESDGCLVPAGSFSESPGICRALPRGGLRYCQLMFDVHALVFVEGLEMDSFHPGSLRPIPADRHIWAEVLGLFPNLEHGMEHYGPLVRPRVMH